MAGFIMRQHTWKGQNFYDIDMDTQEGKANILANYLWRKRVIKGVESPETPDLDDTQQLNDAVSFLNEVNNDNNLGSTDKYPYYLERAKIILKKVADMLIDTETGWEIDPSKHDIQKGTDDFKIITNSNNEDVGVYLYMRSVEKKNPVPEGSVEYEITKVNEKLLLGYTFRGVNVRPLHTYESSSNSNYYWVTGLFSSMIPSGSSAEFGDVWNAEGFIPPCATKIHSANSTESGTIASENNNNTAYHAQVVTNGHIIAFRVYTEQSRGSLWFVGPLIGTLAHSTMDITEQAKLMDMGFTSCSSEASTTSWYFTSKNSSISNGNEESYYWNNTIELSSSYGRRVQVHMFAADGTLLEGKAGKEIFWDGSLNQLSSCISDSSIVGFNRWVAIYVGVMSQEPSSPGNYIVRGDGMKGYLDTNFLRYVRRNYYTIGQTFDDGNFVYIGRGVAMGWDNSNGAFNAN